MEIHVDSSGWYAHQHEKNPDYNSVVLHVVLHDSGKHLIEHEDKFKIQELELASFINKTPSTSQTQACADLKSFWRTSWTLRSGSGLKWCGDTEKSHCSCRRAAYSKENAATAKALGCIGP
ncbi:MAG: DUF2851 family protein [SAR324 cluster bacterium]